MSNVSQDNLRQRRARQSVGSFPVETEASPADTPRDVVPRNGKVAPQKRRKPDKPDDDDAITWRGMC